MVTVEQIGLDVEVREKEVVLKDVSEAPLFRCDINGALAVEQHFAIDDDAAAPGTQDSGDGIDDGRLAGPRSPEQADDRSFSPKRHRELEIADAALDVDVDHVRRRAKARRVSHSDAISAPMDSTTAIALNRSASASPPGACVRE